MDNLILTSVVISAAVSAVISSGITLLGQLLERRGSQRELMLTTAVGLSKNYMERMAGYSKGIGTLPDIVVLSRMHKMTKDVFERGQVSKEDLDAALRATKELL